MKLRVAYKAYPKPEFTWFNNRNEKIVTPASDDKYSVYIGNTQTIVTIKKPTQEDVGDFKLKAKNSAAEKEFIIKLVKSD